METFMKNIQKHPNYSKQLVHIYLVSSPESTKLQKKAFITLEEVLSSDSYSMFS